MEHLDKELAMKLKDALDDDPLVMGDLLQFIGVYTEQYNKALQEQRTTEATKAVYDVLMSYTIPRKGIPGRLLPSFIAPIHALFPRGYDHAHSEKSKKFLDEFVKSARKENWSPKDHFIDDIRNFKDILTLLYNQYDATTPPKQEQDDADR